MAYLIRNLIADAFKESGVLGIGQTMQAYQTQDGLDSLNLILDEIYATDEGVPTIAKPVTFDGSNSYTVGPLPDVVGDPTPDIEVDSLISRIDRLIITLGGVRNTVLPIDPISYSARPLENVETPLPSYFYFERTSPLSTIRFYEGGPSGAGEIIYTPSIMDVTANTDTKHHPKALRPYLVYELATRVARQNGFETQSLQQASSSAWRKYKQFTYEGQSYQADASAPSGSGSYYDKHSFLRGD